jgi:hypothetical protein
LDCSQQESFPNRFTLHLVITADHNQNRPRTE